MALTNHEAQSLTGAPPGSGYYKGGRRTAYLLAGLGTALLIVLLLFFGPVFARGVRDGLSLVASTLIPSLFCFMVLADFASAPPILRVLSRPLAPVGRHAFHIPPTLTGVYLLSLIGGYPVGAAMVAQQAERGLISKRQAARMLCYCVNAGPSFLVVFIGAQLLQSEQAGLMMLCAQLLSSFCIGLFCGRLAKREDPPKQAAGSQTFSFSQQLVGSVKNACSAMLMISGFVVIFSGLLAFLGAIPFLQRHTALFSLGGAFLEVTTGAVRVAQAGIAYRALLLCFFTALGGLCVFFQVRAMTARAELSLAPFLLSRPVHALLSAGLFYLFLQWFPQSIPAWSSTAPKAAQLWSGEPLASVILLCICVLVILSPGRIAVKGRKGR